MSLTLQLLIGTIMIGFTVIVQAVCLDVIIRAARRVEVLLRARARHLWQPLMSALVAIAVFSVSVFQIWSWALLYMRLGCSAGKDLSIALHFSTILYTTLGFSETAMDEGCRMLYGVEAANGFLLFGWTAAFIFEVISQLYRREAAALKD